MKEIKGMGKSYGANNMVHVTGEKYSTSWVNYTWTVHGPEII